MRFGELSMMLIQDRLNEVDTRFYWRYMSD